MNIHKKENWKFMHLSPAAGNGDFVVYRHAPKDVDGTIYPPIEVNKLLDVQAALKSGFKFLTVKEVLGEIWGIANRYEAGEYDDHEPETLEALRSLVSNVHQHLGPLYEDFLTE